MYQRSGDAFEFALGGVIMVWMTITVITSIVICLSPGVRRKRRAKPILFQPSPEMIEMTPRDPSEPIIDYDPENQHMPNGIHDSKTSPFIFLQHQHSHYDTHVF